MRLFRNLSISTKLNILSSLAVSVALVLCCAAFLYNDVRTLRTVKRQELRSMAMLLGANSISAIEFNDPESATETLASLASQPAVEMAVLYDSRGRALASYPAALPASVLPAQLPTAGTLGDDRRFVEVLQPILPADGVDHGLVDDLSDLLEPRGAERSTTSSREPPTLQEPSPRHVGHVWIRAGTADIQEQIRLRSLATAGVLAISLAAGLLISGMFQKAITSPVNHLVETVRAVSGHQDFSKRAIKHGDDEIGSLCDAFNRMLFEVESGRSRLEQAHDELELRVVERTAELKQAMKEALAASKAKSDFLANMSHEIRTPMTAILGYADLLAEDEDASVETADRIDAIQRNGHHLLLIINDILDVSKIEAGKMTVERISCSLGKVVADLLSLLRRRATEKGLTLEVEYRGEIPAVICTDPTRLRQILINLVGNAIKFSEHGGVKLVVSLQQAESSTPKIQFDVIDTGIGLTETQLSSIFQAFTQADESMTRRYGGTGLGLTISRGLAQLLGGELSVVSQYGQGATFTVTIDTGPLDGIKMFTNCCEAIQGEPRCKDQAPPAATMLNGRILLVEDGLDNKRLISFLLTKAGAEVSTADNGQVGRDLAVQAWRQGQPFDLIFMDMQMPVLDGYEATAQLRAQDYRLPIVALTAHAMSHERDKCIAVGCDDYFTKPVDRAELIALAARWIDVAKRTAIEDNGGTLSTTVAGG